MVVWYRRLMLLATRAKSELEIRYILQDKDVQWWAGDRVTVFADVEIRWEVASPLVEFFDSAVEEAFKLMLSGVRF